MTVVNWSSFGHFCISVEQERIFEVLSTGPTFTRGFVPLLRLPSYCSSDSFKRVLFSQPRSSVSVSCCVAAADVARESRRHHFRLSHDIGFARVAAQPHLYFFLFCFVFTKELKEDSRVLNPAFALVKATKPDYVTRTPAATGHNTSSTKTRSGKV